MCGAAVMLAESEGGMQCMGGITVSPKLHNSLSLNHITPFYLCFLRPQFGSSLLIATMINYSFVYK